ncbi:prolyl aminopeptidase [Hyphomicrobium methylovorum]|uniref:prolyl aminopeptidase n=1 Tax=Hyphomicrobium methylovorum TaxID=84 RepID=UPI0015E70D25|nr:prolyl aminopeptidase [Hyphomicrobium methylovorum]MBA2126883.1 prolyl aminopeptidase [Hyphomicrobium methylovorum]
MNAISEAYRPFDARMLSVGDGHWIYVEEVGRKGGRPVVFLHGGPGSGSQHLHRTLFDPERDHVFLIDQRGAGRSHPYLRFEANTTGHLINDLETVRRHFGISQWLLVGGSWGSTLALAYAEAYPDRVTGLVLRAIFLGTDAEVEWAFVTGPQIFRPELYAAFVDRLPEMERKDPLAAYIARLTGPDDKARLLAAQIWSAYERALSQIAPGNAVLPASVPDDARLPPTPLMEAHYILNEFFLAPNQLLKNAYRLTDIPGRIIQGRYDLLCPPKNARALAAAWPDARLDFIDTAGHDMTEPGVMDALRKAINEIGK